MQLSGRDKNKAASEGREYVKWTVSMQLPRNVQARQMMLFSMSR
jgi:hypothetical protein